MEKVRSKRQFAYGLLVGMFLMIVFFAGALSDRVWNLPGLDKLLVKNPQGIAQNINQRILTEESVVTEVVERVSPAVVTVSATEEQQVTSPFFLDPFGFFQAPSTGQVQTQQIDIGSGFIVDVSGLVVTNKHVVSAGVPDKFKVVLKDGSEHQVEKIWRDPSNDLAILKFSLESKDATSPASKLQAIEMGDSDNLKVGNFVIAIGTALGEFRHTVTTGVVSGLGRGITAGDGLSGFSEQLTNVIQTDAAINPGNSGGPLLNSAGQAIGVNVAVSQSANNIGFALPINVVKDSLKTFNETGQFDRAFFGVKYQTISQEAALLNEVPAGALVREVVVNSTADKGGIKVGDILVSYNGEKIVETEGGLAKLVLGSKIGEKVEIEVYRGGKTIKLQVEMLVEPS